MAHSKAFTLIELLIVIAIIGILSSVVVVSMGNTRAKARDARRMSDMRQILLALELYYDSYGKYPGPTSSYGESESPSCGGWDTSTVDNDKDGKPFIEPLIDTGLMGNVPTDPIGGGTCSGYTYRYYRYSAGSGGCDSSRGAFFVLGVNDMETSSNPYPKKSWLEVP